MPFAAPVSSLVVEVVGITYVVIWIVPDSARALAPDFRLVLPRRSSTL